MTRAPFLLCILKENSSKNAGKKIRQKKMLYSQYKVKTIKIGQSKVTHYELHIFILISTLMD